MCYILEFNQVQNNKYYKQIFNNSVLIEKFMKLCNKIV